MIDCIPGLLADSGRSAPSWQVYSKTRAAHASGETGVPRLRGDALLVEKSEAASAMIYWNGKRYVWSQRGD